MSKGREFKLIEESYGGNVLALVVYVAYLKKLMDNAQVAGYLFKHRAELFTEFQKLFDISDLAPDLDFISR